MSYLRVLDVETTGDDPAKDQIIEVGYYDLFPDGSISEGFTFLARPTVPVTLEARAVHHLTDGELDAGLPQDKIQGFVTAGSPLAYVAHNAKFEASFMPWVKKPWICTFKCALRLWPAAPRHTNQVLRYFLDLDQEPDFEPAKAMPPHRALPDAYTTAHIFRRMLEIEGDHRLRRLVAWSKQPGLLPRIKFGKHKGAAWDEVPADYLDWLVFKSDMDEDAKFTAMTELTRRNFPRN